MKRVIFSNDDWTVEVSETELIVSFFSDYHYQDEISIMIDFINNKHAELLADGRGE